MSKTPWNVRRSLLVREEEETISTYGCRPSDRSIRDLLRLGVVNLDKPPGPTSHDVASTVKRVLDVRRVGHGGTLE